MERRREEIRKRRPKVKTRKLTPKMQARLLLVFCVIVVLLMALIGQLVRIGNTERYEKNALAQQSYVTSVIPYKRGGILDRNGQVLAASELVYHLVLDPKVLLSREENVDLTVKALVDVYGLPEQELRATLVEKPDSSYVVLKRQLSYAEKEAFSQYVAAMPKKDENGEKIKGEVKGVWFEEEYRRTYPLGSVASHIIGFTVSGDVGTYGVEQFYNDRLIGTNGRTYGYYDSRLNIQRTTKAAVDGETVVLTIDVNVQSVAQRIVEKFLNEVGAENVGIILMDANSGEVLAMQSNYSYDLNSPRDLSRWYTKAQTDAMTDQEQLNALYDIWRNFCISDAYEPGSTFKPFTVAAALEENLVTTKSKFTCDGGESFPGNIRIKCSNQWGHGEISLAQSLMFSCNDALMQMAAAEGKELFGAYQRHFLFGEKTGIDLPGETSGKLFPLENLNATELASSSFGQAFTVNMMQMASAFSSLINGGIYYEPHVVRAIKNADGATVDKIDPQDAVRTVSAETSEFIREAMFMTVKDGTAQKAQVEGYLIGGKTGTAQKLPYANKKNLVSFLGFVEYERTRLTVYVVVDEAHDEELMKKSATALSMASEFLEEALPYLKIYPEGEIKYRVEIIGEDDLINNGQGGGQNEEEPNVMD